MRSLPDGGWDPFQAHYAQPVPAYMSLIECLDSRTPLTGSHVNKITSYGTASASVTNSHGWNITLTQFTTFEIHDLFLGPFVRYALNVYVIGGSSEKSELAWWEVEVQVSHKSLLHVTSHPHFGHNSSSDIPVGLEEKLLMKEKPPVGGGQKLNADVVPEGTASAVSAANATNTEPGIAVSGELTTTSKPRKLGMWDFFFEGVMGALRMIFLIIIFQIVKLRTRFFRGGRFFGWRRLDDEETDEEEKKAEEERLMEAGVLENTEEDKDKAKELVK
ncbi:hypothetical protein MMC27_003774 [Xylographa pallens]|nr:hypothetical protein [Xylographa pallens]